NYDVFLYQEKCRKEQDKNYPGTSYNGFSSHLWTMLLFNEQFYYGTISSLDGHLQQKLSDYSYDKIESLIPYETEMIDGEEDEDGFAEVDFVTDANGLEKQLEELEERSRIYLQERSNHFETCYQDDEPGVYIDYYKRDTDSDYAPYGVEFIFNNEQSIKNIRWKHFSSDIKPLVQPLELLHQEIENEKSLLDNYLEEQYQDIMQNFNPKILKFKKKMEIKMSKQVADFIDDKS
ncbi:MAG: hypothetical protein HQL46_14915, partial [Gammaproteobacteria bacterium]|nr:hypothetical protein [Gammaproteobacteria bacterium]